MTRQEFEGWKRITNQSQFRWMQDLICYVNRGEYLFFKGGENGHFIEVDPHGTVMVGTYEGAIPHIHEAGFKVESCKMYASQSDALTALYKAVPELKGAMVK